MFQFVIYDLETIWSQILKVISHETSKTLSKSTIFRGVIDTKNNFITKVANSFDKVKAVISEIKQHQDKNIPGEMEKLKEANEKLAEKQQKIAEDKEELAKKIDELKDELAKQEVKLLILWNWLPIL